MTIKKTTKVLLCAIAVVLIQCFTSAESLAESSVAEKTNNQDDLQAIYSKLEKTDGKVYVLNPKLSSIRIYAFRGGALSSMGHNHVLASPKFTGFVYLPTKGTSFARFDLEFRLDQLEIDNPNNRSVLGEAYASKLTLDDIVGTREHMLGEDNLQANRFPLVKIHSLHVVGEAPKLAIEIQIELHGQQQKMLIPLSVVGLPNHLVATGAFAIRQSDFGVKPYSVFGGVLSVKNEVVIEFSLVGE